MAKRIVTRIGNVFCVEIEGKFKCFFQYIAKDMTQLNSSVIRVFKTHYPMEYKPVISDIIKDEIAFYAHTVLYAGIYFNAWYKVGTSKELGLEGLQKIWFGYAQRDTTEKIDGLWTIIELNPLENWWIWHVNEPFIKIGVLPKEYEDILERGSVLPYNEIVMRIKSGYYIYTRADYDIIKRKPLSDYHSYLKREEDKTIVYYHFVGDSLQQRLTLSEDGTTVLSVESVGSQDSNIARIKFYDINWEYRHFISKEEFETIWKKMVNI